MPASSVGTFNSWAIYFIASIALVLVLSPLLTGSVRDSREGADWRTTDGVRAVLDALRPGVRLGLSYGLASDPLQLNGHRVSCSYGRGTVSLPVRWELPNITLLPSVEYEVWLNGGQVQVTQAG